ncbi:MAG: 40S ribosomal protein S6 [Chaenotheca gracillima]|nr:MAG: 40S ribosomal protein S6 [Chaenotheca gracillima]
MPTIFLHPPSPNRSNPSLGVSNPLPSLLQTPSGFAILELQGTINLPESGSEPTLSSPQDQSDSPGGAVPVGRLVFPDRVPGATDDTAWMKNVYLYIGRHQRLTGEVKKLPNPMAVIRKKDAVTEDDAMDLDSGQEFKQNEDLEITEIVRWKILFSQRPEPVGN